MGDNAEIGDVEEWIHLAQDSDPVAASSTTATRWFKYDQVKLSLVYTQTVPVIFESPCN
jgi:hypothetical protein